MKFADITNDIAFRKIFGNENHKQVIISFLNAILDFTGDRRIIDVSILDPYQLPKLTGGKYSIVDVRAEDQRGDYYLIEMQMTDVKGFDKRVQYNAAKAYSGKMERGEFFDILKPVVFVGILDFQLSAAPKYLSRHRVQNIETGEHILKDIEFNFIELPKFAIAQKQLKTLAEKWIYFIKNAKNLDVIPDDINDEGLRLAWEDANLQTWTQKEENDYIGVTFKEQEDIIRMRTAEEKGMEKGIEKGKEENLKDIVIKLAAKGKTDEEISGLLDIPVDKVKVLRSPLP